jgi:hypothetical protein
MVQSNPTIKGFFSYSRQNDMHDGGKLSLLRKSLEMEIWDQSGEETGIFQDQEDIYWGQQWKERIAKALDNSNFFIAVITPSYLRSESCRFEFEYFLEREKRLGGERILSLLYIETPELKSKSDAIAIEITKRQWFDWTHLRFSDLTSTRIRKLLARSAKQIVNLSRKELLIEPRKQSTSIPNSVLTETQWVTVQQPSFDNATAVVNLEPKITKAEITPAPKPAFSYIPFPGDEEEKPSLKIILSFPSQKDPEVDRRRIKTIYGTLISFHGRDRFSFHIFENEKSHTIDFPNDTTRICPELLIRLKKILGNETWTIEPIS